jgi:hypothetical protein
MVRAEDEVVRTTEDVVETTSVAPGLQARAAERKE